MAPKTLKRRPPRDSGRVFLEAGAIVDELHQVFDPSLSLRVDRLIVLAEALRAEEF